MILNLSNFIHSLLLENETVIIPGFGAFISNYKPAEILENEIIPPSKEISFTQQIKNNDGLLVELIARKAKISQTNALKRVEKARENMLYELDKGETIILENIGSLIFDKNNEIQFTSFKKDNLLLDSFGLETISTEDYVEISIENKIVEDESDAVVSEIKEVEKAEEVESEETHPTIQTEAVSDVPSEIIHEVEKETTTLQNPVSEKIQLPKFNPAAVQEIPEERKKIGWYWYLLILIPVFIGGYFLINKNQTPDKAETRNNPVKLAEPQNVQVEKSVPADTIQNNLDAVTETDSTLNKNQEKLLINETSKYYVVGGSFKNEENAEKYILKLKEKGIDGFQLGRKGSLYLVGVESFNNEADAQILLNQLVKSYPEWNLWIYKK